MAAIEAAESVKSEGITSPFASEVNVVDHTLVRRSWRKTPSPFITILDHSYPGEGTDEAPYIVTWLPSGDTENPLTYPAGTKWGSTFCASAATMVVSMASSMLSAAIVDIRRDFPGQSDQLYVMVTGIFVLGFVVGPIVFAPCSEVFGRRSISIYTYIPFTIFNAITCASNSLGMMLVFRFLSGVFGSSAMVNSGGIIADLFDARERGLAMGFFAASPFVGPAISPVIGGFVSEASSWRIVSMIIALLSGSVLLAQALWQPETYAPVLLRRRAALLSKVTGKVYRSEQDSRKPLVTKDLFMKQLKVPWTLLFHEPIVLILGLYLSVIYAILYMGFTSFPLVFIGVRQWSSGISGLTFIGITIGAMISLAYIVFYENPRYAKRLDAQGGYLPPEQRLPSVIAGSILLPAGLFIFAWTCAPSSIHWIVPMLATVPYGMGIVFLFLGVSNYLVDAYLMYAASVLAGGTILRSAFGVVLPLFTPNIYARLGVNWAGTLVAALALVFSPCPFLLYLYGRRIRRTTKYGREADDLASRMAAARSEATAQASQVAVQNAPDGQEAVESITPQAGSGAGDRV